MHTQTQLVEFAAILDQASFWQRLVGNDYKLAVRAYRRIATHSKKADRSQMSRALRNVAEYRQSRQRFDNNHHYRQALGAHFKGVESDWDGLRALILWYEKVFVTLPEHHASSEPFRQVLLTARIDRLKGIKAKSTPIKTHREVLNQIVEHVTEFTRSVPSLKSLVMSGTFDEILTDLQRLSRDLSDVLYTVEQAALLDNVTLRNVPDLLASVNECRNSLAAVQSVGEISGLLGDLHHGVNTDVEPIKRTLAFAESISASGLPALALDNIMCRVRISAFVSQNINVGMCRKALKQMRRRVARGEAGGFCDMGRITDDQGTR